MNRFSIFIILFLCSITWLLLTGFQCGSPEETSAKLYMKQEQWEDAEKAFMKEVEKNPSNVEAWFFVGQVRLKRAEIEGGRNNFSEQYRHLQGVSPAFDASLKTGKDHEKDIKILKENGWGQAFNLGVNLYNKSLSGSKDDASKLQYEAIDAYKLAITFNADSAKTYKYMALTYIALGNDDEVITSTKLALDRKKESESYERLINSYLRKADAAEAQGKKDEAKSYYTNAMNELMEARKIDPANEELLKTMIDLSIKLGKAEEAKPSIREAIQKNPTNKAYQYNLGVLLLQSDSLEVAIQHFEAALSIDSLYDVALHNDGIAHLRLGAKIKEATDPKSGDNKRYLEKFNRAVVLLERLSKIKSDDPNVWDILATAYGNAGLYKKAEAAIKKSDELRKK